MRFKKHSNLRGEHAFLSPSNYHWINYTPDRLVERWFTSQASAAGSQQHSYALGEIQAGRLSDLDGILGTYINDAIKYQMTPEQPLYYSENCFGTADAISFRDRLLQIFDLKTGVYPGSVHQLEVYAALFCLEYGQDPFEIDIELRVYQDNEISVWDADPEDIIFIMDKIREFDTIIDQLKRDDEEVIS